MFSYSSLFNSVWVQLVDRLQQKLDLVLIPIQLFRPCRPIRRTNIIESSMSAPSICRHPAQILCSVFSQNWINVTKGQEKLLPTDFFSTDNIFRSTIFYIFYRRMNQIRCGSYLPRKNRAIVICIFTRYSLFCLQTRPLILTVN